jgi:hypothetical protein
MNEKNFHLKSSPKSLPDEIAFLDEDLPAHLLERENYPRDTQPSPQRRIMLQKKAEEEDQRVQKERKAQESERRKVDDVPSVPETELFFYENRGFFKWKKKLVSALAFAEGIMLVTRTKKYLTIDRIRIDEREKIEFGKIDSKACLMIKEMRNSGEQRIHYVRAASISSLTIWLQKLMELFDERWRVVRRQLQEVRK